MTYLSDVEEVGSLDVDLVLTDVASLSELCFVSLDFLLLNAGLLRRNSKDTSLSTGESGSAVIAAGIDLTVKIIRLNRGN